MADSSVPITSGTGTNIDTRTESTNSNHRQVIVIGDPATNAGVAPVDVTNGLAVQVIPALPAGTNAIGKLAANSGVDIGDVDVTSVPADPFGANADAAVAAGATGSIQAKLRRVTSDLDAVKTAVETIDNVVAGSEAQVDVVTSALPTGASTLAEQQSQTTHLATIAGDTTDIEAAVELLDDTVATLGTTTYTEATTKGLVVGAVRRDADTTLADTTNEVAPLQVDANGRLKVEAFSGETLPVSLTSTTVTGTVAVTQSGTWDEVGINDSGNSITVDNGGTFAVQATAVGTVADDGTTPGAPVMIGGKAVETDGTDPTSVSAEDDVAILRTDRNRRVLVNTYHPNLWKTNENNASAQTNNQLKAAPGANLSLYITDIIVSNGATAGTLKLVEDEGGTPVDILGPIYMAINGGAVINLTTPLRLTANKSLGYTSATVTTHTISVNGFTAP